MTRPKQVQILVCKINRSIMNSTYVEVTHFLYPKMVSSNFLQVYDTISMNYLDSHFQPLFNTVTSNTSPQISVCLLFCMSQGLLLIMTQS